VHQVLRVLSLFGTWKSVGKGRVICIALDQQFSKIKGFGFHPWPTVLNNQSSKRVFIDKRTYTKPLRVLSIWSWNPLVLWLSECLNTPTKGYYWINQIWELHKSGIMYASLQDIPLCL
jgi:hypothetical protein